MPHSGCTRSWLRRPWVSSFPANLAHRAPAELECYDTPAVVTDHDAGTEHRRGVDPVTAEAIVQILSKPVERAKHKVGAAIAKLLAAPECGCATQAIPRPGGD